MQTVDAEKMLAIQFIHVMLFMLLCTIRALSLRNCRRRQTYHQEWVVSIVHSSSVATMIF